ncbi:MAG: GNAT family N-acetyltransferase [Saprospiraceae bacterium]
MEIVIRQEEKADWETVEQLVELAFKTMPFSNGTEHQIVKRLRHSAAFVPELSLVAELDKQIIGHILISKIQIENDTQSVEGLSLAPVSVHPDYQRRGIGGQLIWRAHEIAQKLGFQSVVLLGHKDYYPRFGYRQTRDFGIKLPFNSAPENCMIIELQPSSLAGVTGIVKYPKAFFE